MELHSSFEWLDGCLAPSSTKMINGFLEKATLHGSTEGLNLSFEIMALKNGLASEKSFLTVILTHKDSEP
jgi:hypothetical protein